MLINLVPEFLAALAAADPLEAYHTYLNAHRSILQPYWHNYVLDLDSPKLRRFGAADQRGLEALATIFVKSCAP